MSDIEERDPFALFAAWMAEAEASEPEDPNAMALATADAAGRPSVRMVLLKGADARGFVFYTNLESDKGKQLAANPQAALCLHWKSLRRQVRVEGRVVPVSDGEADDYFQSRARDSRIGAWASRQSRPMEGRWELETRVAQYVAKFNIGHVPRPPFWSGFRVVPDRIEFWRDRPFRLHERLVFLREVAAPAADPAAEKHGDWRTERLFP
ncbi:MAG TPA: pyridoxamine 5'-phosphate oxidase [Azospirillaceae bacterium]|nr:pyridoxamine 5'-phosphate oxidase [Azospirillaceae bacterium]HRQ81365.1 pyridoxamine 5'-phosphate oxidase [Azospirillaceae bacterium]